MRSKHCDGSVHHTMNKYRSSLTPGPSWRSPFNIYSAAPLEDYTASKKKKMAGKKNKIKNSAFSLVMMGKAGARRRKDNLEIKKGERGENPCQLLFNFKRNPHAHTHTRPSPPP